MTRLVLLCAWFCALACVVAASPAQAVAGLTFTYVSNTGSNSNNCATPATACADFATALSKTASFGEIDCVNAGLYGTLTIAQSVTIDCAGAVGATQGPITINAAGIVVRLRNMSVNSTGVISTAITAENMAALYIENCVISNYSDLGINFEPSSGTSLLSVTNSIISNNGTSGGGITGGIYITPASGVTATVSIDRSEINGNYFGIVGDGRSGGTIRGTISDSVVSGSAKNGITALSSGSSVVFIIDQTKVSGNLAGLYASGSNAGILARNTTVFNNTIGLDSASGGALYTYGNNSVNGNTTNGSFTGTAALQ